VFQAAGNGDDEVESDEDDSYWSQYDQFTATATTPGLESESFDQTNARTEITSRLEDPSSYYDQYDNVETAISSGGGGTRDFAPPAGESVASSGIDGSTENGLDDIGMEDYIRITVRNLSQLALRAGISDKRLRQLITESMN